MSEATDRCEQLREALTKCEGRLGAALEQVMACADSCFTRGRQRLVQVAELQEKAKGMRSPAPAVVSKTSGSPSSSALRFRCRNSQRNSQHMSRLGALPSVDLSHHVRVDELTAELENLKRLSAQKQLQDKVPQPLARACVLVLDS